MKTRLLPLTTLITALFVLNARADISTGLVGYWSLNDGSGSSTAADLSGNGGTGTLTAFNDATYQYMWTNSPDPVNGWLFDMAFPGTNNPYVSIPDSVSLDSPVTTKKFTVAAWVKSSGTPGANGGCIVAKGSGTTVSGGFWSYLLDLNSANKFRVIMNNSTGGSTQTATSSTVAAAGTWYHVVGIYDSGGYAGGTAREVIYVNGVNVGNSGTGTTLTTVAANTHVVTIGNRQTGTTTYNCPFPGTIDDVRVYNRALTAADVTQLYGNRAATFINTNIGSWNGLAGSGGNATLDSTSLNFCTNLFSATVGTPSSLANLLAVESANALTTGCILADTYYSHSNLVVVASSNLTIAVGGVAPGTITFANNITPYLVASSDAIGIKDGTSPTTFVQAGLSTTILTGRNTFSGGATINAGTIVLGNGGALTGQELGTGTVTDTSALVFNGNNSLSFTPTISGNGSVTQMGSGTLTLNTANSYSGGTTISNSTVSAASLADASSSLGTGAVNLNGGTLLYTGANDITARQFNGTTGTTNGLDVPGGATLELSGRVTAGGGWTVNKTGNGILTLSGTGDNAFLGMNVNAGTVILNKGSGTGHAIGNPLTVAGGATVQFGTSGYASNIFNSATAPVTINSGAILDLNGQNQTFNLLVISGTGSGSGALVNSAGSTTATLTTSVTLAGDTTIGGAGSIALAGAVTGAGRALTYAGGGTLSTLTLGVANSYSGLTTITSGLLDGSAVGSIPGNVTLSGTGALQLDNAAAMAATAILTLPSSPSAGLVTLNLSGATQSIGGLVIGGVTQPSGTYGATGNLNVTYQNAAFVGSGVLSVVQTYWDANGTDASNGSSAFGGGSGNWNNATAKWWISANTDVTWPAGNVAFFAGTAGTVTLNDNVSAGGLNFITPGYTINNTDGTSVLTLGGIAPVVSFPAGTPTTVSCKLAGASGVIYNGPGGTLNVSGANTYTGGTTINGGSTVNMNAIADSGTSALGAGAVTLGTVGGAGANLNFTGASGLTANPVTINGTASSTINVPSGDSLELDGSVIPGTASAAQVLNLTGGGTLTLGGATTNTALTMAIQQGTVVLNKTSAATANGLGSGTTTVGTGTGGNSAKLQLSGTGSDNLNSSCNLTINSPDGVFDLNGQNEGMRVLTLSGAGPDGHGALINNNSTPASLTNSSTGIVLAANTSMGGSGNIILNSKVSGASSLTYAGTGTLTLTNANTYSGGTIINSGGTVTLFNAPSAGGTGAITDNGTLNVAIVGNNVVFSNAVSGPGTINVVETSGNNLQLGGSLSGFTGILHCPTSPGSSAKASILTSDVSINSLATINVDAGGTLYVQSAIIPCPLHLFGEGNTETFGALRLQAGGVISGPVTLHGNTTMGNNQTAAGNFGTVSGPIGESGGSFGITFMPAPGTLVLLATNTYSGATTISNTSLGQVVIGGAGQLGSGIYAAAISNYGTFNYASSAPQTLSGVVSGTGTLIQGGPGALTLSGANTFTGGIMVSNTGTLAISGSGSLGADTGSSYAGNITNNGAFHFASSAAQTLSGSISGSGALIETGPGQLSLTAGNTYTGSTVITNGATLVLGLSGSVNATASITLGTGATLDVSAYSAYSMLSGITLNASGTGTTPGSTAATIKGSASGGATVIVAGPLALTYKPQSFSGDATHPALFVSQISAGQLVLSSSSITVNNAGGSPLGAGTYSLVQVAAGGTISLGSPTVTVTGSGLAAGATASVSASGGSVNLVVSAAAPVPGINSVSLSGTDMIFSGTNGPSNGSYHVLTSTNVALPLSQWVTNATGAFSPTGTFSVTNAINGPLRFFVIKTP